jgi:hypothetical protein
MADLFQHIPTPAQMEALGVAFERASARHAQWDPLGLLAVRTLLRQRLGALGDLEEHPFQRGPTPEQIAAMAAGIGRISTAARLAAVLMVEAFETALPAQRGPTIGRKRRKRRARGRRIEVRRARGPGLLTVEQWAAAHRTRQRQQEGQADA